MSPIDTIIMMLDSYADSYQQQANARSIRNQEEREYNLCLCGKAAGLREAAGHLRNLQKLFN